MAVVLVAFLFTSVFTLSLNSQAASKVKSISVRNVTSGELTLAKGQKITLESVVNPKNAKNKTLKYKSSNTKIVTVSSTGRVEAKKVGTAKITIQSKANTKVKQTIKVTVVSKSDFVAVQKIVPDYNELEMAVDETDTIALTFYPADASNTNVRFSSSDEDVVVVDSNGEFTAVGEGEAVITIKACDGSKVKAKIEIHVINSSSDSTDDETDDENDDTVY